MKVLELTSNFIIMISLQLLLKHQYQLLESVQIQQHTQSRQSLTTLSTKFCKMVQGQQILMFNTTISV